MLFGEITRNANYDFIYTMQHPIIIPHDIHSKILFELRNEIKNPISIIFQKSLEEGVLPNEWKHANVKPIHKKGSKKTPNNYRPVSHTSICGKVQERILRDALVKHLEDNKLLSREQHFSNSASCNDTYIFI